MIVEMAGRLSSPEFIGRQTELDRLAAAFAAASEGRPSLVLLAGEAGVGKSRLVAQATGAASDAGGLVLEGGAIDLGDTPLPFGPIVEALRGLLADRWPRARCGRPRRTDQGGSRPPAPRDRASVATAAGFSAPARVAPGADVRGSPRPPRPSRPTAARRPGRRRRPLGRSLDPRSAGVPRPEPA